MVSETRETSPSSKVDDIEVGQDAPQAVDLRIVSVQLRQCQAESTNDNGSRKRRNKRVGIEIQMLQASHVDAIGPDLLRQAVELWEERLDRLCVVCAILQGLDHRNSHVWFYSRLLVVWFG